MAGAQIRLRRNNSASWAALNPILGPGEQGFESDTGHFRIGDGLTHWNDLDSFIPSSEILELVNELISDGSGGVVSLELAQHINSETPHPVYDDGPSLLVAYENAKV